MDHGQKTLLPVDHLQIEILTRLVRAELYILKQWEDDKNNNYGGKTCEIHVKSCAGLLAALKLEAKIYESK